MALTKTSSEGLSTRELCGRLYRAAPVLKLVTDPDGLEEYVARELSRRDGSPGRRSLRGLVVRLLTDFTEFCLQELNRKLQLPAERRLRLLADEPPSPPGGP